MSGKLLAHFLMRNESFRGQTVTLVGFSLGTQVCKSCVNRLAKLNCNDLVHNVYFLAGATFIKDQER